MREVGQGSPITLTVQFRDAAGNLSTPDETHADIVAPDGSTHIDNLIPVQIDVGTYSYTFAVASDAALGTWSVVWYGTLAGVTSSSMEEFAVVTPSAVPDTSAIVTRLRRLIGERIPIGKDETATRFTNQEIADVYYINSGNMDKTLAELWLAKHAYLVDYVDTVESGTSRQLSQMSRAALMQVSKYEARVQAQEDAWSATYRALPRTFSPYSPTNGSRLPIGVVIVFDDPQRAWTPA